MENIIGKHLGQYEIISLIGDGGMASVYLGRQESVGRQVAIKIIKGNLLQIPEFIERFRREARTIASLNHPNIVKIIDYGQQDDLVYLVMEYQKGGNLGQQIRKASLSPEYIQKVIKQISSALDYAHKNGIVHRDLKPFNVLLDEHGNAILTDFGIAKLMEASSLTRPDVTIGTPTYMAPEQWQGEPVDARTDIYAFGIMLFEMLTGRLPFKADTPLSLKLMHIHELPPSINRINPNLPVGLDQIIDKALAKHPDHRFQTAGELSQAFDDLLAGKGVLSAEQRTEPAYRGDSTRDKGKVTGNNRSWLLWVGILALALVGVAGLLIQNSQAPSVTATLVAALPTSTETMINPVATQIPTVLIVSPSPTADILQTAQLIVAMTFDAAQTSTSEVIASYTLTDIPTAIPSTTFTPSPTPTETVTPTFTHTSTLIPTDTLTNTVTFTTTPTETYTATPLPTSTTTPSLTPTQQKMTVVYADVSAKTRGWQSTSLTIDANTKVQIAVVEGQWTHWKGNIPYNQGTGASNYICGQAMSAAKCVEPLPSAATGALIGRVVKQVFKVGRSVTVTTEQAGILELGINDDPNGLYDNDGSLKVKITVFN